ncbi:MAG TPA: hypothetical protein VFJ02_02900 [Vicinamibacterales bacterium]|nr:hypothetical protein [Vicinamibacterales bacterium]
MRFRRAAGVVLVVAAIGSSANCGANADRRARELRRTAGSWAATLRTATDEWARDALPAHFVASTIDVARQELTREGDRVRSQSGAGASAAADEVLAALTPLRAAVERGDRGSAIAVAHAVADRIPSEPTPPVARPQ